MDPFPLDECASRLLMFLELCFHRADALDVSEAPFASQHSGEGLPLSLMADIKQLTTALRPTLQYKLRCNVVRYGL